MNWPHFITNAIFTKDEPLSLVHFLTDRCNARCPHCFVDFTDPVPADKLLSLDEIRGLTKTMGSSLYNVNLTGGEPFLREDLFEIVSAYFANTTVKSIVITSNGTLVAAVRSFVDKFARSGIKGRIKLSFSLDHVEDRHDALRNVKGAFTSVLESYRIVEGCRDGRIMPDIALTVTPYNYQDIVALHASLKGRGIRHFSAILMREAGAVNRIADKSAVFSAYDQLASRIEADERSYPASHRLQETIRRAKNALVKDIYSAIYCAPRHQVACSAGSLFGVIYPGGDVYPCEVLDSDYCFGNVRDTGLNFMRLWRSEQAVSARALQLRSSCSCTYECAWSVNVVTRPVYWARMFMVWCRNLVWNRKA